jgi:hypothetical protein
VCNGFKAKVVIISKEKTIIFMQNLFIQSDAENHADEAFTIWL